MLRSVNVLLYAVILMLLSAVAPAVELNVVDENISGAGERHQGDFHCIEGQTILISKVNDGVSDCSFGEDEDMRPDFDCGGGNTIPASEVNDNNTDCSNGADENFWGCDNGQSIWHRFVYNNHSDCSDGSDEPSSQVDRFSCVNGVGAVFFTEVHDGDYDCSDNSDEMVVLNCENGNSNYLNYYGEAAACSDGSFGPDYNRPPYQCDSGTVTEVPASKINDGTADCSDGSDEPPTDADGDGVNDGDDLCPNTNNGAIVDSDGCADYQKDSDGDGVSDDIDACPGHDDNVDVDGDGTADGCDDLVDSDGDGVADEQDACPGHDDNVDDDNDGIPDGCDNLVDSDDDGVADEQDACPGHDVKPPARPAPPR